MDDFKEYILAILMGLLAWLGKRQVDRVDKIEASHVTRAELKETLKELESHRAAERQRMHEENRENAKNIQDSLGRIHERVDQLWDRK